MKERARILRVVRTLLSCARRKMPARWDGDDLGVLLACPEDSFRVEDPQGGQDWPEPFDKSIAPVHAARLGEHPDFYEPRDREYVLGEFQKLAPRYALAVIGSAHQHWIRAEASDIECEQAVFRRVLVGDLRFEDAELRDAETVLRMIETRLASGPQPPAPAAEKAEGRRASPRRRQKGVTETRIMVAMQILVAKQGDFSAKQVAEQAGCSATRVKESKPWEAVMSGRRRAGRHGPRRARPKEIPFGKDPKQPVKGAKKPSVC